MSTATLYAFRDGLPEVEAEFRNSHGGSYRIWDSLFQRYCKNPDIPYDNCLQDNERVWVLFDRKDLSLCERAVLGFTFDFAIVKRKNFKRFADDLREFVKLYPREVNKVDHLGAIADAIEQCDAEAVGWYGTSAADNLFVGWDYGTDEEVLYNINTGDKHFEVYEEL